MERLNRGNQQFSKENSVSRNVCVNGTNRMVQEISNDSSCKLYSHDLSSDKLNKSLKSEKCVPAYQCDKPSGYIFVDVGSDLIEGEYLLEEVDDICKVNSETLFTDIKDIDYNLVKNVNIGRRLKNSSNENEVHNHKLETTVFNINDICTGIDRPGLSTDTCMVNMCENLDDYDRKPSIDIDYTTTSTVVSAFGGFEKVNIHVKEEKGIEDVLLHQSTKHVSPEIKKEEMVYNDEVSVLNESIIDIKLHQVNKVEESQEISTNYSWVLDKNSKVGSIVLSKSVKSDFHEAYTECLEEVPDNSDIRNVMILKPLEENETVQSKRKSHLKLQNKVPTQSRTCSELQTKAQTNSGDDTGAAGVEDCNKKLSEDDVNIETKNKNDAICQHYRKRKSENTTDRHYVCKVCDKDFTHLCDVKAHKCSYTGDRPFGCDTCGKAFRRDDALKKHKRIHTGDGPFGCSICDKAFKLQGNLNRHKRTHTGEKPFVCSTCSKTFKHLTSLKRHKRIHTGAKPFDCNTCGKTFTELSSLKHHKRIHTGERPFSCDTCGKAFRRDDVLKNHKRIHIADRPFGCSICGKAFKVRGNLNKHKRSHTREKPFVCSTCGKTFKRQTSLKRHERIHTGVRPFGCNTCGKTFTQLVSLNVHKLIHTGDRPFGCDTCGKAFRRDDALKNHKRIHTGERPFGCSICGKAFKVQSNLYKHKHTHTLKETICLK